MNSINTNNAIAHFIAEIEHEIDDTHTTFNQDNIEHSLRQISIIWEQTRSSLDPSLSVKIQDIYTKLTKANLSDEKAAKIKQALSALDGWMKNLKSKDKLKEEAKGSHSNYIAAATLLSLGSSQVIGSLTAVAKVINGVWHATQALKAQISGSLIKAKLSRYKILALQKPDDVRIQRELQRLHDLLNGNELNRHQAIEGMKHNARHFVAALMSLVPLVGVIGAAAFLNATSKVTAVKSLTGIQRGAEEIMQGVTSPLGAFVRSCLYSLGGCRQTFDQYCKQLAQREKVSIDVISNQYSHMLQDLQAKEVRVPVERGDGVQHTIRCQFINTQNNPAAETIILLHGSGMVGEDMGGAAKFYKDRGLNVMMVTMGGYPGSDEHLSTSEASSIQDMNAVLKHLEKQGVNSIGLHGFSIGGTLAMHATQLSDKVKFCCIDKSLDNARNVAANLISNIGRSQVPLLKMIPKAIIRGIIGAGFPIDQPVPGVADKNGQPYKTDGCDNLSKASKYDGVLVTLSGERDLFMNYGFDQVTGKFTDNFPQDMHRAHAMKNPSRSFHSHSPVVGHDMEMREGKVAITQGLQAAFTTLKEVEETPLHRSTPTTGMPFTAERLALLKKAMLPISADDQATLLRRTEWLSEAQRDIWWKSLHDGGQKDSES